MKLANLAGRAVIVTDAGAVDVERASGGAFGPDVQALYDRWPDLRAWAAQHCWLAASRKSPFAISTTLSGMLTFSHPAGPYVYGTA